MRKIVRLNENDIEKLVKKIIREDDIENLNTIDVDSLNEIWPKREIDRKNTNFRKRNFRPYDREKDIKGLFGSYGEDIPPQVLQYLRKNPAALIKRLVKAYGIDEIYGYIEDAQMGMQESYKLNDIISEKKEENFIQKAEKKMEKKGTVGSFREYCGGEVTMGCINKALKSGDPSIVKKANYAKHIGGYKGAKHEK